MLRLSGNPEALWDPLVYFLWLVTGTGGWRKRSGESVSEFFNRDIIEHRRGTKSPLGDVRRARMYRMLKVEEAPNRTTAERRAPGGPGCGPRRVWNTVTGSPERSTKWALCVRDLSRQSLIRKPNKGEPQELPV